MLGAIMGDFIKGRLEGFYSPRIGRGIDLHRKIDVFAHENSHFRRSKYRIHPHFGHYRAIMVDIFYDHLLARNWALYSSLSLEDFADRVYEILQENADNLPEGLATVAPRMISHNWLVSYRKMEVVDTVLKRISARLRRPNPMGGGIGELKRNFSGMEADCRKFLLEARAFAAHYLAEP